MKIEAVKVKRLYLEVARQLKNLISSGQIGVGQRLPSERDLADKFKVSRPTIREAMIALEISGLVEIRTGSGIYVRKQVITSSKPLVDDVPGPFEILEARRLVETEAVVLAAARISKEQLKELKNALAEMEREDSDSSVSEAADQRFHCIIGEATQNSALATTISWLWELRNNSEISTLFHKRVREKGVHPSLDDHKRIYLAIKSKDPFAAKSAMLDHISKAIEADIAAFETSDE